MLIYPQEVKPDNSWYRLREKYVLQDIIFATTSLKSADLMKDIVMLLQRLFTLQWKMADPRLRDSLKESNLQTLSLCKLSYLHLHKNLYHSQYNNELNACSINLFPSTKLAPRRKRSTNIMHTFFVLIFHDVHEYKFEGKKTRVILFSPLLSNLHIPV